ncbi:hypothetical protein EU527_19205 [Candidatus Thorarchaeota archaeon]|nr:MAG: hypothetical protein EU527_19205 [Candidatus Thorarchaeota archaeon]
MIRNLIIIDKTNRPLVSANFGECHSFGEDDSMISGFLSALYNLSKMFNAESLDEIQLGGLSFTVMSKGSLVFAISADDTDATTHKTTLTEIIEIFEDLYEFYSTSVEPDVDITPFKEFPKFLVDQNVLKPNCGKYSECSDCPNNVKSLPLQEMTAELEAEKK